MQQILLSLPRVLSHKSAKKFICFYVVLLNNYMKQLKDKLTHAQFGILRKQNQSKLATDKWLKNSGFNTATFNNLNPKLLQAQLTAHTLITQHPNLLTTEQSKTLRDFQRRVGNTKLCARLKPEAAYPVLNIATKINRQLFATHKLLPKLGT
jgi:N-glycosylase/DNA lyase